MRISAGHLACLLDNHPKIESTDIITSITFAKDAIYIKGEGRDSVGSKVELDLKITDAEAADICGPVKIEHKGNKTILS